MTEERYPTAQEQWLNRIHEVGIGLTLILSRLLRAAIIYQSDRDDAKRIIAEWDKLWEERPK